jgi:hypothetical protein
VEAALSDFRGVVGLEQLPRQTLGHRKSMYAGVRIQIKGRAGPNFSVRKVAAHVDPDGCTDPDERYRAIGNQRADEHAKAAALAQPGPSTAELEEWRAEVAFLRRFLLFVPRALALWPQVGPTSGKKSLPKRDGFVARSSGSSFASDLLHPWLEPAAGSSSQLQEVEPPAAEDLPQAGVEPPPPQEGLGGPRTRSSQEAARHSWVWQSGRWLCTACLTTSRGSVPRRIYGCKGMAPNLADLLQRPRKHALQVATFSSGGGIVVICRKCGHYATSNRPCGLHKKDCKRGFTSQGAETAYQRVSQGMRPKHDRGDAKVLDPCMDGAALLALGAQEVSS